MTETYTDDNGVERCDECEQTIDECACTCPDCGDGVHDDCACEQE